MRSPVESAKRRKNIAGLHSDSMDVWILRHAKAEESAASGRDEDRALTRGGTRRAAAVARGLAALEPEIEAILTPPYPPAREAAARAPVESAATERRSQPWGNSVSDASPCSSSSP